MIGPTPAPGFFFAGYIDPSAGHVFSSLGPAIASIVGGLVGVLAVFFFRAKDSLKSVFKKVSDVSKKSRSRRD